MRNKSLIIHLIFYFLGLNLTGCATQNYTVTPTQAFITQGLYHKVLPGETLWRISQIYNIDLEELVSVNKIPDAAKIEKGQMIFIPGKKATSIIEPEKVFPSESNFIWPSKGKVIAYFDQLFQDRLNKGINIQIKPNEEIVSSRAGKVVFADSLKGYNQTVIIEHGDGFSSVYALNSQIFAKPNDLVVQGMVIAKADAVKSQQLNFLHFEIRKGSKAQNPLFYLP
ncbi:MAG: peptidoglycan DD-metalloendopeptidase family protein [Candidatus Omnitrophota bacterium]|nr:peptidoglycan DD-metalloendopeptidase family protein [Candidatus Omnitrophota bacterium]